MILLCEYFFSTLFLWEYFIFMSTLFLWVLSFCVKTMFSRESLIFVCVFHFCVSALFSSDYQICVRVSFCLWVLYIVSILRRICFKFFNMEILDFKEYSLGEAIFSGHTCPKLWGKIWISQIQTNKITYFSVKVINL